MTTAINSLLFRRVTARGFRPSHVAEVGVWHPETSMVLPYIHDGVRTTLVEPDPDSIVLIKEAFAGRENVTLHPVAACDFSGTVELCKRESSTFVSFLSSSPALVNDDCDISRTETFTAEARLFSEIDDGTIDLLSVDTEGSEWFVVKNLKSRPAVISVETHGGMYRNPYLREIKAWMADNRYRLWYRDKSDSVYVKQDAISVSFWDRLGLLGSAVMLPVKATRKRLSRWIKKTVR